MGINMRTYKRTYGFVLLAGSLTSAAIAGPDWIEEGDAGSTLDDAQDITPVGVINTIAGTLGGQDTEDIYKLVILDGDDIAGAVQFGLNLDQGQTGFNPSLWLFDAYGFGVLGNDDDPILGGPDARLIAPSTDGVTLLLPPGTYFLAITESGNVPLSFRPGGGALNGEGTYEEIFSFDSITEVSGPDGVGADNPLAAWTGGPGTSGGYGITITPAPGSVALLALAGVGITRRRR